MKPEDSVLNKRISRRNFLQASAILGGALGTVGVLSPILGRAQAPGIYSIPGPNPVDTAEGMRLIRSVCLMCHSACGVQYLVDPTGRLLKVDGNPYHPNNSDPHLPYDTAPSTVARARLCAKGQAGMEQAYTPLRIKHPLKRVGPRGSGEWEVITWDQAFTEIIEGGDLFGEGHVDGLRAIRDLDNPADPNAPELGPKANQMVFAVGRHEHGRKEFTDPFWKYAYGTINYRNDHTSICELSHHVAFAAMFQGKTHLKPDILNSKYIIWFGTSPLEANFPMIALSRKLMEFKKRGGKMVVVDPRFSNSAAKADVWVPVKPGTDAALALGIARWILDNGKYDEAFLRNTDKAGANAGDEASWSNATYLVRLDDNSLLHASDAGIEGGGDEWVVASNGEPVIYDSVEQADLEADLEVNGIPCKSAFMLYRERVQEKTIPEYAEICDVDVALIEQIASDFAAAGKQAVADCYRGAVQHTNGTYNAMAIIGLNLLMGNVDWKGGLVAGGSHWHEDGSKSSNKYDLKSNWPLKDDPKRVSPSGALISRDNKSSIKYEDTTEFKQNGYPAKRPWFPLANMIWQEVFAGIDQGYPYPVKALMLVMADPAFTTPAGQLIEETLKDTSKLPLYVCVDRVMSEAAAVADYILPDVGFPERYETPHVSPAIQTKTSGVRQPFWQEEDGHILPKVKKVLPDTMDLIDMLVEIGRRMDLAGIGDDAFGPGLPMNEARDWFSKTIANLAVESGGVPGATEEEQVRYLLARGGRFEDADKAYDGDKVAHKFGERIDFYLEKYATTRNVMTGDFFDGLPKYEPIQDAKGNLVEDSDYPFHLTTYKPVMHTQSRTIENDLLLSLMDTNFVEIHEDDAKVLGVKTGDRVRVTSRSNQEGVVGHAHVGLSVKRGIVAIAMSFGHWQYGAQGWKTDRESVEADAIRGAGVNSNLVMRVDESVGNVALQDLIGGSVSFYDTRVNLETV